LRTTRHVFEAARLEPAGADGVVSRLTAEQPVDIGQRKDAGVGKEFGHGSGGFDFLAEWLKAALMPVSDAALGSQLRDEESVHQVRQ